MKTLENTSPEFDSAFLAFYLKIDIYVIDWLQFARKITSKNWGFPLTNICHFHMPI